VHCIHGVDSFLVLRHEDEAAEKQINGVSVACAARRTYRRRPIPSSCERSVECSTVPKDRKSARNCCLMGISADCQLRGACGKLLQEARPTRTH
jgi:hypothetical protein